MNSDGLDQLVQVGLSVVDIWLNLVTASQLAGERASDLDGEELCRFVEFPTLSQSRTLGHLLTADRWPHHGRPRAHEGYAFLGRSNVSSTVR